MMKKVLAVILILVLMFSFTCCKPSETAENLSSQVTSYEISENESVSSPEKKPVSSQEEKSSSSSNASTSSVVSEQETKPAAPDIAKISCRKASEMSWQRIKITVKKSKHSFEFDIPSDWKLTETDGGFEILRADKKIGTILSEDTSFGEDLDADYAYSSDYSSSLYHYTKWGLENGKERLYRHLILSTFPQVSNIQIHILLDFTEIDVDGVKYITDKASVYETKAEFVPLSQTNGSKKILILGNSFVGTSQIGSFLSAMLRASESEYTVEAISIGGANVQTFVGRTDIMEKIKNGEYCYVFQCGFYSSIAVSAFNTVKQNCESSGTIPVIFPAHNENASASHARGQYNDTIYLDWQTELNNLIKSGIDRYDLCYDDSFDHSKPLAGYVGAHMIYRNVFGKLPPAEISCEVQSIESVRSYLGDYIETGVIPGVDVRPAFTGKSYSIA